MFVGTCLIAHDMGYVCKTWEPPMHWWEEYLLGGLEPAGACATLALSARSSSDRVSSDMEDSIWVLVGCAAADAASEAE